MAKAKTKTKTKTKVKAQGTTKRRKFKPAIGWREWVALPQLGIEALKAKTDTGARSSALHAFDLEPFSRGGKNYVRFKVHPYQRLSKITVTTEAEVIEERLVRNSGGHQSLRPVILTPIVLLGQEYEIELTLVNRDEMGFRMLLGRQAVRRRFVVDPGRSFLGGKTKPKG